MARSSRSVLAEFGVTSFVSQSALAKILQKVRTDGLPESCSRRSIKRSREDAVRVLTTHGPLIKTLQINFQEDGNAKALDVEYIDPAAMLSHAASVSEAFASFLGGRLEAHSCSYDRPWRLILYADEISPGNQLKHMNARKIQGVYWAFAEYGPAGLCNEVLWNVLTTVRSTVVKRVGGMSFFVKHLLQAFLADTDFRQGVTVWTGDAYKIIFASLRTLVSDEAAIKSLWDHKGSSGILPCLICRNVVLRRSGLHDSDDSGTLTSICEDDPAKFIMHNDSTLKETCRMLQSQKPILGPGAFTMLEKSVGINYREENILFSHWVLHDHIQPISMTMYDWMHCFMVGGSWNIEVGRLLAVLAANGHSHKAVHSFFQSLTFPTSLTAKGATGKDVFAKRPSASSDDPIKCSASEALSCYGPLRIYLMLHVQAEPGSLLFNCAQSYYALAAVVDILCAIQKGEPNATPEQLQDALCLHFKMFKLAYGIEPVVPKHHFSMHLPKMFREHGYLVSCWTHERKHKEVKRFANNMSNTHSRFDANVLEAVAQAHVHALKDIANYPTMEVQLDQPKLAPPDVADFFQARFQDQSDVLVSNKVFYGPSRSCSVKDVVMFTLDGVSRIGQVWFHASIRGQCYSCLDCWITLGNNRFQVTEQPVVVGSGSISNVCIYRQTEDIVTVVPFASF